MSLKVCRCQHTGNGENSSDVLVHITDNTFIDRVLCPHAKTYTYGDGGKEIWCKRKSGWDKSAIGIINYSKPVNPDFKNPPLCSFDAVNWCQGQDY